ncbi:MAG: hypothetical protein AVDCRST_MAG15-2883, partial [uncultured Rubellimicrobium sp.]
AGAPIPVPLPALSWSLPRTRPKAAPNGKGLPRSLRGRPL